MSSSPSKSSCKYKKKISIVKNDTIGDFKIGRKIGQGTFSKVCQGVHIPTGEKVAIKILPKNQIKEKSDKIRIEKEISLQKKLHHQNIIQQYSILDTESSIYIITEYCSGGELFDYIVSKRRLQEIEACRIFQQLINGLEYLHKQKICHRDLKPENLLFDSKHNLKIADFGLSNDYLYGKLSTPCGSPCYAAPEMVTGKKYYGDTVDIWSSGIVLYSMVCGYLPFEDDSQSVLFHKIAKGLFIMPSFLSNSCKDLIKNILVTNPKKRYGFEDIKKHPWFMSVNNIGGKNIIFNSPGILIDYDVIPIDVNIIKEIYYTKEYKNFSILNIVNDVIRNKHNKITTAYYLILKKKLRNNEESVSNINSNSKLFIDYIKKPISKMDYWNNDYDKIIEYYTNKAKEVINKEKESKKKIEIEKNKKSKKIKNNNLEINILNINEISNILNEDENESKYLELNFINDDIKLSTIVYDDEEKDLLKFRNRSKVHKKKINNINNRSKKDNDEAYLEYKMNNYELDSDEPIIKEMLDSSRNKRQFNEIAKTKENIIEENENNSINSEDKQNLFNKIIKNAENSIEIDKNKKIKGRNDKNKIKRKNNSVCIGKNNKIKDLFLSDKKQINNQSILMTEVNKKKYHNLSCDKPNKKEKNNKNINNSINDKKTKDNNRGKKEKAKNKKLNTKKISLPNNSYFYRKIASMIGKEEKMIKFINKKKSNNLSQKGKEEKIKNKNINEKFDNYYFKKINEKFKYNKRNESQEYKNIHNDNNYINTSTTNITNGQRESSSVSKIKKELAPNNQPKINYISNKINNLQVKNINNYNIDIYKYKINLINNNLTYLKENNLQEIYKKINNIHKINRYNKFISINSNKKNNYNNKISLKKKKYLNNSINLNPNSNLIIKKYLITENNNKFYKKSCPSHFNYLDIFINGISKKKINPILLSEKTTKNRKIINSINEEKMKLKRLYNKSIDKNYLKSDKNQNKIKKYIPMKTQNGRPYSMENKVIKSKKVLNKSNIQNKHLIIKNTYCFNGSNKNISFLKEKTPKNHLITDINENINRNYELNSNLIDKINNRSKHYSYDIKNGFKYIDNMNNNNYNRIYNKKNMIYHKKLVNINRRYNNSVENDTRKKKYILELLNSNPNNKQNNNSLLSLNANKFKNKDNIFMKINLSKNNVYNYNKKTSLKNIKGMLIKRNHFLSMEKDNKKYNIDNNQFNIPIKSNILSNNNNNIYKQKNKNFKENSKTNNYYEKKVIDKINKISSLICCKCSIDKIKELTEKIFFKNDKNNSIINVAVSYSGAILKCKNLNKINNLCFELHVSSFKDIKNYAIIKPTLIKGNNLLFEELFEKLKNELIN